MDHITVEEFCLTLPAYAEPGREKLPMFAENRVHQRSSGNPYPNPVVLSVSRDHPEDKRFRCVALENNYLRIELLPELGGRIYSALDKTTGYDFFYKQHVIKPALIGMLGSWISGGVEFNWPCHHRPSTFMPVDYVIEHESNGAVTVWMSEHEPLNRMKGMVGIRLVPGEARFETRMRVFNRTNTRRSFLWWENAAVPVNESYELFFPPDVRFVQFHYRKDVTSYPIAKGVYNGIRMSGPTDIRWHKNTRQPTSYFSASSHYDFFGGYDHDRQAGVVHVADHTVSAGKKMFTWAYNQLSASWERALTDSDGPYAELMAGSYSANQPDFSWLEPYEEKSFSQSWYPISGIGTPLAATIDAAVSWHDNDLMIQAARPVCGTVVINGTDRSRISLMPGRPVTVKRLSLLNSLDLEDDSGNVLLSYHPQEDRPENTPRPIRDNPTLDSLHSADECYRAGLHTAQYRDPALSPAAYWREALKYDKDHAGAHHELARYLYDHFYYEEALEHAEKTWRVITQYNEHPVSGDICYLIGLILEALGRDDEARDWYGRASLVQDSRSRAMTRIAMLDGRKRAWAKMLQHAEEAISAHPGNGTAWAEKAFAYFKCGQTESARNALEKRLEHDPCDLMCDSILGFIGGQSQIHRMTDARQVFLDLEEDLADMGAHEIVQSLACPQAHNSPTAWPSRHSELKRLRDTGEDPFGLACLYYANGHYDRAAEIWRRLTDDYRAVRCLAVAYYSHLDRRNEVPELLEQAIDMAPGDMQLVFEKAYVMGRMRVPPRDIVDFLKPYCGKGAREDIVIEYVRALNACGAYEEAVNALLSRRFTPCEGGEHAVALQYMAAMHGLAKRHYRNGDHAEALKYFRSAQKLPDSLGAGLWNEVHLVPHRFFEAECLRNLNRKEEADAIYTDITALYIDYFSNMHLPELRCWQALSWKRLGQDGRGEMMLLDHIRQYEEAACHRDAGYFGTTPFFISYMEPADKLRKAASNWQLAMAYWAMGERSVSMKHLSLAMEGEPFLVYARILKDDESLPD